MRTSTFRLELGDFRCFVINDASQLHSADDLLAGADHKRLERLAGELGFCLDEVPVDYNVLLVDTGDQNVLVDAGFWGPDSKLLQGLEALGYHSGSIGTIVITHSDMDHIGGILDDEDQLVFANARYVMLQESWEHWSSVENRSRLAALNNWPEQKMEFVWEIYSRIEELLVPVKYEHEFLPGFRLIPAVGHRCDHAVLQVTSSGEQLLHLSDAVVHPLLMVDQDWYSTYDSDPAQAVETKRELLEWCASEEALAFGAHFPFPGIGHVQKHHEGWQWKPKYLVTRPTR